MCTRCGGSDGLPQVPPEWHAAPRADHRQEPQRHGCWLLPWKGPGVPVSTNRSAAGHGADRGEAVPGEAVPGGAVPGGMRSACVDHPTRSGCHPIEPTAQICQIGQADRIDHIGLALVGPDRGGPARGDHVENDHHPGRRHHGGCGRDDWGDRHRNVLLLVNGDQNGSSWAERATAGRCRSPRVDP